MLQKTIKIGLKQMENNRKMSVKKKKKGQQQ